MPAAVLARENIVRRRFHPESLKLREHHSLPALGADAVPETDIGMRTNVAFHLMPVVLIVAYFLAVGADRQEPLELLHSAEGIFELRDAQSQLGLQAHH